MFLIESLNYKRVEVTSSRWLQVLAAEGWMHHNVLNLDLSENNYSDNGVQCFYVNSHSSGENKTVKQVFTWTTLSVRALYMPETYGAWLFRLQTIMLAGDPQRFANATTNEHYFLKVKYYSEYTTSYSYSSLSYYNCMYCREKPPTTDLPTVPAWSTDQSSESVIGINWLVGNDVISNEQLACLPITPHTHKNIHILFSLSLCVVRSVRCLVLGRTE